MTVGNLSVATPGNSGTEGAAVMKDNHKTATAAAGAPRSRYADLKQMLEERRREIQAEVQGKMRGVREEGTWGGKLNEVLDAVESAEADIQEELEFSLVQMKSETLNKINDALVRLDQGSYGNCFECGEEIAEKRLRALPFAVRCKDCEEAREVAEQRERQMAARRGTSGLFLDM
jgi:DnaK suppressor protein